MTKKTAPTGMPWNEAIRKLGEDAAKERAEQNVERIAKEHERQKKRDELIARSDSSPELIAAMKKLEEFSGASMLQQAKNMPALHDSNFDSENVIAGFTLNDNDFSQSLRLFVHELAYEVASSELDVLTTEQKETYFHEVWNRTCSAFHYLETVRAHHIAKWGDDLYEPKGFGDHHKTHNYMATRMKVRFDNRAKEMFYDNAKFGNGEFYFVDKHGNVGWS